MPGNGKYLALSQHLLECIEKELTEVENLELYSAREIFLECIEKVIIHEALRRSKGRKGGAAKLLGINVKTLYNKLSHKNKVAEILAENRENAADSQEITLATK